MTEKIYDENGYDQNGFDRQGYNAYGEMDPERVIFNQEFEDVRAVCRTEAGRRFIWRVLGMCNVFGDFEPLQSDKEDQKQIGRRSVGLQLMGVIEEADRDVFLKMMNENHLKEKEKEHARRTYRRS